MKNPVTMLKNVFEDLKQHWKEPAAKKYIPYKEMTAYSVGGTGVYFIIAMVGLISMSAGSMIVGASIGIKAVDLQTMNVVSTLVGLILAPIRAMAFDNTRSKMGKFRPYLLYMGIPTAFFATLLVFLPYETMAYERKVVSVFVVFTLLQIFSPFYTAAYAGLVQVMSPNTEERAWTIEVSSIVYSLAPTITNPVIPLIGPLDSLSTYRITFPIFCTIGAVVSMLCVFGTRERIIVPKRYTPKVGFFEGFKKVSKNKYFWIINGSTWISFLNGGYGFLFPWIFYYGMNNPAMYALMTIIRGEASLPGMILGAPLSNKFGKKRVCIFSILMQTLCIALMLICYKSYAMIFIMMFIKDLFGALAIIYLPAMKADVIDYQQYKTGDRLEGFIEQTGGLLGSIIALGTGYAIPLILRAQGLTNNYADLYNTEFRNPIVYIMLICSVIGTGLSVVPFFFYDLTEQRRANMIKVLKIRALFEDFSHGELTDVSLVDTVEEIVEANEIINSNYDKSNKNESEKYEAAKITLEEFNKFSTSEMLNRIENAERLIQNGPQALESYLEFLQERYNNLQNNSKEEKRIKKYSKNEIKEVKRSIILINKLFPQGIIEPDESEIKNAYSLPEETKEQRTFKKQSIKVAEHKMKLFEDAAKPYTDAKKLIKQYNAYKNWPEIEERYHALIKVTE